MWLVAGAGGAAIAIRLRLQWRWPVWLVAGLAVACLRIDARTDDRLDAALTGQNLQVDGWVDGFVRPTGGQLSFPLRIVGGADGFDLPARVRLTWYDPPLEVTPGMDLALTVRLRQPHGLRNPGGFDYERWLFLEGYGATGYVRAGMTRIDSVRRPARQWLKHRAAIAARIHEAVPARNAAALLTALAIGERFAFEEQHWQTLRRTGTSHLVAISGLHVGIVSALIFFLTRWLWLRGPLTLAVYDLEASAVTSFLSAVGYAALAGFSVPAQRALIMLVVALVSVVLRRRTTMLAGLSIALLFVLLWDPLAPLSASFWLSFAAVALIWQLGSLRTLAERDLGIVRRWWRGVVRTQLGITIGLLPIVALAFGELSIVSPLANLLAIPFFSLVLVPLALVATLALAVPPVGAVLFGCAATLMQWSWVLLSGLAAQPWAATPLPQIASWQMLLLFFGAVIALPVHALPGRQLGWIVMLVPLVARPARPEEGAFEANVLDVGHGLAVVVQTHDHTLLYDAGARYRSGFDTGREIVLPALRHFGIETLDRIVISHADNDHAGGLDAVLTEFPDAEPIVGPDVDRYGATHCRRGQHWSWDDVEFEILHPPAGYARRGNDNSCVLRIATSSGVLLLTGDIETRGEQTLIAATRNLSSDVIVVPHHGSATSSSAFFTAQVRPRYAVVSAAFANQWGFPKPDVRARWEGTGGRMLMTGDAGAIAITFPPQGEPVLRSERGRWPLPWRLETGL